jgi:hypothetical protein
MEKPRGYKLETDAGFLTVAGMTAELVVRRKLPKSDRAYAHIGRVVVAWSHFEHVLDQIIWSLSGVDEMTGSCITTKLSGHRQRLEIIQTLLKRRELQVEIDKDLIGIISRIAGKRNDYVHNVWFMEERNGKGGKIGQVRSFRASKNQFGFHVVSLEQLDKTTAEIENLIRVLISLRLDILSHL